MKIRACELTGKALDWATQKAIGWHFATHAERKAYGAGYADVVQAARNVVQEKLGDPSQYPELHEVIRDRFNGVLPDLRER